MGTCIQRDHEGQEAIYSMPMVQLQAKFDERVEAAVAHGLTVTEDRLKETVIDPWLVAGLEKFDGSDQKSVCLELRVVSVPERQVETDALTSSDLKDQAKELCFVLQAAWKGWWKQE